LCANCTRDRGCSEHPVFPAPSDFKGANEIQTSGDQRRENAASYSVVIVREGGRSSIPEMPVIESMSRSVLDTPPSRGTTSSFVAHDLDDPTEDHPSCESPWTKENNPASQYAY
jgi:hypothetical protein